MNRKKVLGKIYIKGLEGYAQFADLTLGLIPKVRLKGMTKFYTEANRVRKKIGEKPKQYFTIEERKKVRLV